jgi:hypothetical protein
MFGPAHGMTIEVGDPPMKDFVVAEAPDYERDFLRQYRFGDGMPPDLGERMKVHHYQLYDAFSSMNAEDCAIYTHNEMCCDKTYADSPDAKEAARMRARGMDYHPLPMGKDVWF